jgi:adenylosuccinate lyase
MACVKKGLSRQDAHEEIRMLLHRLFYHKVRSLISRPTGVLSHQASDNVKKLGKNNDLIERVRRTAFFAPILDELDTLLDPSTFVGRAPQQVEKFTSTEVKKALQPYGEHLLKAETAALYV